MESGFTTRKNRQTHTHIYIFVPLITTYHPGIHSLRSILKRVTQSPYLIPPPAIVSLAPPQLPLPYFRQLRFRPNLDPRLHWLTSGSYPCQNPPVKPCLKQRNNLSFTSPVTNLAYPIQAPPKTSSSSSLALNVMSSIWVKQKKKYARYKERPSFLLQQSLHSISQQFPLIVLEMYLHIITYSNTYHITRRHLDLAYHLIQSSGFSHNFHTICSPSLKTPFFLFVPWWL